MLLLELPTELLLQIMDDIGPRYFRKDLRRLAISKKWFDCARTAYLKNFEISQKYLERVMSMPAPVRKKALESIEHFLETLTLNLCGFEDWNLFLAPNVLKHQPLHQAMAHRQAQLDSRPVLTSWTHALNRDMESLAHTSQKATRLRTLKIHARAERTISLFNYPFRHYLHESSLLKFLALKTLTTLDLDLGGTSLVPSQKGPHVHICESIGALLATLRCLRLRMRNICPAILTPSDGTTMLRLTEVVVNLSLAQKRGCHHHHKPSNAIACTWNGRMPELRMDMIRRAKALSLQMASPRVVRVLSNGNKRVLQSLDVLTGELEELDLAGGGGKRVTKEDV